MGMQVGKVVTSGNQTKIELRNKDGSTAGTLTISKPKKNIKKKRLTYNFKKISNRIMTAKTSSGAGKVVREARSELVALLMKQKSGKFDDKAVQDAITHARSMERVAKKRRKHIEQEERAQNTGSSLVEEEADIAEEEKTEEEQEQEQTQEQAELTSEELEQISQELEQLMKESMEAMRDLADELMSASYEEMDDKDIEKMKKRHRAEEMRDILEADMKYLKALFDRLAKEQRDNASGAGSFDTAPDSANTSGVSLQLAGVDVPVESSAAPVSAEGAVVDVSL